MEYFAGIIVAIIIAALASILGFDKDKSFYPVILIIIAVFYVLFAIMSGSIDTIIRESVIAFVFIIVAITGAKKTVFIIAFGLIVHGIFDIFHNQFITNTSVPAWWPMFCAIVDIVLGTWVMYLTKKRSNKSLPPTAESGG